MTKNSKEREEMKTQKDNCGLEKNKEEAFLFVVLLHCSFHNVNHEKFQSSGKNITHNSVGYLIVLDKVISSEMSYEASDSTQRQRYCRVVFL